MTLTTFKFSIRIYRILVFRFLSGNFLDRCRTIASKIFKNDFLILHFSVPGCLTHYWYIYLDRFMGRGRSQRLVLKKVLIDQIVFSPVNLVCYFATVGLLERRSLRYIAEEFKQKGMANIYLVEWGIWPAAQYVNFYLLPMRYRILFDNVISFFFDIYSPYVKYHHETELKGQSVDEPSSKQSSGEKVRDKSPASEKSESKSARRDKSEIGHPAANQIATG